MKKALLSLLLAAATLGASAQSFTFSYTDEKDDNGPINYKVVNDGDEIVIDNLIDLIPLDPGYVYELAAFFSITSTSSDWQSVTMTVDANPDINTLEAGVRSFCYPGNCTSPDQFPTTFSKGLSAGEVVAGNSFDISIEFESETIEPIDLTDPKYAGAWGVDVNITSTTGDTLSATFIFQIPDSGIEGVKADSNAAKQYYNLQGVRVAEPTTGLYIVRQGSKASKVLF